MLFHIINKFLCLRPILNSSIFKIIKLFYILKFDTPLNWNFQVLIIYKS